MVMAAKETLGLANTYLDEFDKLAQELIETEISQAKFQSVVEKIYPKPTKIDLKGSLTKWENKIETIKFIYNGPTNEMISGTAWGALNAITERLDWYRPVRKDNGESMAASASGFDAITNKEKARVLYAVKQLVAA